MKTISSNTCEILLDGSTGEGGGQILRSALSLSAITGRSFRLERIRAGRKRPGLMRQHLTCVQSVASICGARTSALELGSDCLSFWPGDIEACHDVISIGTAGSTALVAQTILPVLLYAKDDSDVTIEGGTHVSFAPCFEYLNEIYLPVLRRMGCSVDLSIGRHGFFPAGAGLVSLSVRPGRPRSLELFAEGRNARSYSLCAEVISTRCIPATVAEKELRAIRQQLVLTGQQCRTSVVDGCACEGNVLLIRVLATDDSASPGTLSFALGEHGKPSRQVAREAVKAIRRFLGSTAAVDQHLADQLLLPLALAGGGGYTTVALTPHFHSNVEVIEAFLPVKITTESLDARAHRVAIEAK